MDDVAVKLPAELCRRVEEKLLGPAGETLEELLVFVLEELLEDSADVEEAEEDFLRERLRDLGYLSRE